MMRDYLNTNKYLSTSKYFNTDKYTNIDKYTLKNTYEHLYKPFSKKSINEMSKYSSYDMKNSLPYENSRSNLDRIFDALLLPVYVGAGAIKSTIEEANPVEGIVEGIRASNPFGSGYEKGEVTYSRVLESAGWKPQGIVGKIAKGVIGFSLDVLLDPTTYFSGGSSALVKGTGKAGYLSTHAKTIAKVAEEYGVDISRGLDIVDARKIIVDNAIRRQVTLSGDELQHGAELLSKEYNRIAGVNRVASDLTYGVRNFPGGTKLFPDSELKVISKAENIQKLGEKTIAPYYAKLRNNIYGSQLGKLFGRETKIYQATKDDPGKVYDYLASLEKTRGLNISNLQKIELYNKAAKEMNLTPAENKQVLDMMQDSTVWSRVTKTINYLSTKQGLKHWEDISAQQESTVKYVNLIVNKKKILQAKRDVAMVNKNVAREELKKVERQFNEELSNLKVTQINDRDTLHKVIKMYQEEIAHLEGLQKVVVEKPPVVKPIDGEKIAKLEEEVNVNKEKIDQLKSEVKPYLDKWVALKDKESPEALLLKQQMKEVNDEIKALKDVEDPSEAYKSIIEEYDNYVKALEENSKLSSSLKFQLVRNISKALTGNERYLSISTYKNNIDVLIDMMKKGNSQKKILRFIEENSQHYDGRLAEVYSFIGERLGYGYGKNYKYETWQQMYSDRLKVFLDIIKDGKQLTPYQLQRVAELQQLNFQRQHLLSLFQEVGQDGVVRFKNIDDIMDIKTREANRTMTNDYKKFKEETFPVNVRGVEESEIRAIKKNQDMLSASSKKDDMSDEVVKIGEPKYTTEEIKAEVARRRKEAREEGASKYQQDKISKEVKEQMSNAKITVDDIRIMLKKHEKQKYDNPANVNNFLRSLLEAEEKENAKIYSTKLTPKEDEEIRTILSQMAFTLNGGKELGNGVLRYIDNVVIEAQHLLTAVFKTDYSSLEKKQIQLLLDWASTNVLYGTTHDKTVKKAFREEIYKRQKKLRDEHINKYVMRNTDVDVKIGDSITRVKVESYELSKNGKVTYKASDVYGRDIYFNPDDVVNIYKNDKAKTIDELIYSSEITKTTVQRIDELTAKLENLEIKLKSVEEGYAQDVVEVEGKYKQILDDISVVERDLKNTRARLRYANKKNEKSIENTKLISDLQKQEEKLLLRLEEKRAILKQGEEALATPDTRVKELIESYKESSVKLKENIVRLDKKIVKFNKQLESAEFDQIEKLSKEIDDVNEILYNEEAFDSFMRTKLGDKKVDADILKDKGLLVKFAVRDDLLVDEKIKGIAEFLRNDFVKMGLEEVEIGKLTMGQLEHMVYHYMPHVVTESGYKMFAKDEITKTLPGFGDGLGYGREFNPFGMKRTLVLPDGKGGYLQQPTIDEINTFFKETVRGNNVFADDVADIYLARAQKHNDLMYDNEYMNNMLELFGEEYKLGSKIESGYKIVMNYGMMKKHLADMAGLHITCDITEGVDEYLKKSGIIDVLKTKVHAQMLNFMDVNDPLWNKTYQRMLSSRISKEIGNFVEENYPQKIRKTMFDEHLKNVTTKSEIMNQVENIATPMVELSEKQIYNTQLTYEETLDRFLETIKSKVVSLEKARWYARTPNPYPAKQLSEFIERLSSMDSQRLRNFVHSYDGVFDEMDDMRLQRVYEKLDKHDSYKLQIKQVHETIVDKANQARLIQVAKDNNRMLQLYDKMTHIIKLNQTTVIPSFHIRNKHSNTFNNWLVVGLDATNKELQINSMKTMWHMSKDSADKVKDLTVNINGIETKWVDLYQTAMQYGVIDKGYFAKDIGVGVKTDGVLKSIPSKFDPTDTKNFVWYKKGAEIGGIIENQDRLLHFVAQLRNGMDYREAAESVNKTLFDYSDLTSFEQNIMKRIIPYYTWLRKNAQLQLEMMLEHPDKYQFVAKIMSGIEGMNNEEDLNNKEFVNEFAKDWVQTPFEVTNPEGKKEGVLWNPNLPFMDINRIPSLSAPVQSITNLFTQTNPMIKLPIEEIVNKNYFYDSPIVDEGESQLNRVNHVMTNYAPYNVAKGMVQKSGADLALHTFNNMFGIKMLSYDYDKYKMMKIQQMLKDGKSFDTVYRETISDIFNTFGGGLVRGFKGSVSSAIDFVGDEVMSDRPKKAIEYTGALRPISQAKYNRLNSYEKKKYTPPDKDTAVAYSVKAVELEKQQMAEQGVGKKMVWALFETVHVGSRNKEYEFGEVTRVIDGDTFEINVGGNVHNVRMLLIDTPESVKQDMIEQPVAKKASDYSKKALMGRDTKIIFDGSRKDIYGRTLGYVEIDGSDYQEELLKQGLAQTGYLFEPPYSRYKKYTEIETEAYNNKRGIWQIPDYAKPNDDSGYTTYYDKKKVDAINRRLKW